MRSSTLIYAVLAYLSIVFLRFLARWAEIRRARASVKLGTLSYASLNRPLRPSDLVTSLLWPIEVAFRLVGVAADLTAPAPAAPVASPSRRADTPQGSGMSTEGRKDLVREWIDEAYSVILWADTFERISEVVNVGSPAVDALLHALEKRRHQDPRYTPQARALVMNALAKIGDRRAVPAIRGQLNSAHGGPKVWDAAAFALGRLGDPAALSDLRRAAAEGRAPEAATEALEALGIDTTPREVVTLSRIAEAESLFAKYDKVGNPKCAELRAALRELRIERPGRAHAALQSQMVEGCQIRAGDLDTTLAALVRCIITDQEFSVGPARRGIKEPFTLRTEGGTYLFRDIHSLAVWTVYSHIVVRVSSDRYLSFVHRPTGS